MKERRVKYIITKQEKHPHEQSMYLKVIFKPKPLSVNPKANWVGDLLS